MSRRRLMLAAAGIAVCTATTPLLAQQAQRVFRIGELRPTAPPLPSDSVAHLLETTLAEAGYTVGRNLVIESRFASGNIGKLPDLARELVAQRLDAIFTVGSAAAKAARQSAPDLPLVFYGNFDAVAIGLVTSLAQPGANATGVLIASEGTLAAKRLQLLKEMVPRATRIALLAPDDAGFSLQMQEVHKAASELGVQLIDVVVVAGDYERAFASATAARVEAMFVGAHTFAFRDRKRIIELAARHRLPATYEWPEQAQDGGFMAYGTSLRGTYASIAGQLDRILRGARAGDLPVVQPTHFELVVNLATARTLGLAVPKAMLLRADRVIE